MPESPGPYTTITVHEFSRLSATIKHLRRQVQKAREMLEKGDGKGALGVLRFEDEHLGSS